MSKIITADQSADLIKDGSTIGIGAIGLTGWPDELAEAIQKKFLSTGHPKNLSLCQGSAVGDWKERSTNRWAYEGLFTRWVGAHIGSAVHLGKLISENKMKAYNLPQGVIVSLWREIGAKRPGVITKVGLGTFVDPRIEGGKMNSITTEDIVEVIEIGGEEYLFYKSFPLDVALIRGTTVDENGNLTMDKEGVLLETLQLAMAAKSSGGIVIAQAEYLAKAGTLHPKSIKVPGILVDYIVIANRKDSCWQTEGTYFQPAFSGDIRIPHDKIPALPMNERKIIARRASMELKYDYVINLGVGIPSDVGTVVAEEKISNKLIMTTEVGAIGGVPAPLPHFGFSYNVEAVMEHADMFDFYDGGGLDLAVLGLAQVDKYGNVNVSKFNNRPVGCGGFINISQSSKKLVFTGTFTAGGLEVKVDNCKLQIVQEGKNIKFIDQVEQITYSGTYASKIKQEVLYITERAVFTLEDGQITLIEIAPGIDLEKDIISLMGFKPKISPNLKEMPSSIFCEEWGQLKGVIEANLNDKPVCSPEQPNLYGGFL